MVQTVIAGVYRGEGPRGGALEPLPGTELLAECTAAASAAADAIRLWRVGDRHRVESWEEVAVDQVAWIDPANAGFADASGERPRGATIRLGGQTRELLFPTPLQQAMRLRTLADWVIRRRLLKIPGVAEVFVQGGERKQYQILADPAAMIEYGVSLPMVEEALRASNINTSGGFAVEGESERPIRILGRLGPDPEQVIENIAQATQAIVAAGAMPVVLGGEHTVTFGVIEGMLRAGVDNLGVVQIDAHADLRDAYEGDPLSHASVMRRIVDRAVPLYQLGIRAFWHVFHVAGFDLVTELLDHRLAALLVLVGPAVVANRADINEANLEWISGRNAQGGAKAKGGDKGAQQGFFALLEHGRWNSVMCGDVVVKQLSVGLQKADQLDN